MAGNKDERLRCNLLEVDLVHSGKGKKREKMELTPAIFCVRVVSEVRGRAACFQSLYGLVVLSNGVRL